MPPIPSDIVRPEREPDEPSESDEEAEHDAAHAAINPVSEAGKEESSLAEAVDMDRSACAAAARDPADAGIAVATGVTPRSGTRRLKQRSAEQQQRQPSARPSDSAAAAPLAIFAALAAGSWLLFRALRRRPGKPMQAAAATGPAPGRPALVRKLSLSAEAASSREPQPLGGTTFAIADLFDVEGEVRGAASNGSTAAAERTAPLLLALQRAGARCTAKAANPDLNLGMLGEVEDMTPNPAAPHRVSAGAGGGCASAVAAGDVRFALGVDHLAGIRVAAACCGTYGFRASHGAVAREGVAATVLGLEAVAWAAADAEMLQAVGAALQLPGKALKGEVVRIVLCKDLFAGCDIEMAPAYVALHDAARRWAGADLTNQVPLCVFLADQMPGLAAFRADENTSVLDALVDAAEALQVAELQQAHPALVDALEEVSEESLAAARQVAAEAREAIRRACAGGVLLAAPALPGLPPRRDAPPADLHAFEDRTLQLTALATLAGAPQVVLPVALPDGNTMAVSLLGAPRSDMQLLHVAAKLAPHIAGAAAAPRMRPQQRQQRQQEQQQVAAAAGGNRSPGGAAGAAAAQPDSSAAPGQAEKAQGNAAFKAGDYLGAMQAYSAAIAADQRNPVYYSNRAMAALKVFEYDQAEEDCSTALALESPVLNPKTLLRRATARLGLGKIAAARADFRQVVSLEPGNRHAREELRNLEGMDDTMFGGSAAQLGAAAAGFA